MRPLLIAVALAGGSCAAAQPPSTDAAHAVVVPGAARNGVVSLTEAPRGRVVIDDAYRLIETFPTTRARNLVIEGLTGTNIRREGVRLRAGGTFENITFRNFSFKHAAQPNVSPDLPEGFHIEAGSGIVLENGLIEGFQMTRAPDKYWNGDGVATEAAVVDFTARNVISRNNTDAGMDLKSKRNMLDDVTLSGNCRNLRIWPGSNTEVGTLTSNQPICRGGSAGPTHLFVTGSYAQPPQIHIKHLVVNQTNKTHIFELGHGAASLTIDRCDLSVPAGTPFFYGLKPQMTLGPGCTIPPE